MCILLPPSATCRYYTHVMISNYVQRKQYTLFSVGPTLRKSTLILPGQALYHSHHGLVASPASQFHGAAHGGARTCDLGVGGTTVLSLTL
jgi:hypothetical protein